MNLIEYAFNNKEKERVRVQLVNELIELKSVFTESDKIQLSFMLQAMADSKVTLPATISEHRKAAEKQ